jgi:hypothetical protein
VRHDTETFFWCIVFIVLGLSLAFCVIDDVHRQAACRAGGGAVERIAGNGWRGWQCVRR